MSESPKEEVKVEEKVAASTTSSLTAEQLASVLSAKQKRKLGLLPPREYTEKEKQRLEALRERMRAINNKRKEDKEKAMKARQQEASPPPAPKKKRPEPESESGSEDESSDHYIQKKAKKVNKTLHQMSKMDKYIAELRQQNSHNPFFNLLMR